MTPLLLLFYRNSRTARMSCEMPRGDLHSFSFISLVFVDFRRPLESSERPQSTHNLTGCLTPRGASGHSRGHSQVLAYHYAPSIAAVTYILNEAAILLIIAPSHNTGKLQLCQCSSCRQESASSAKRPPHHQASSS